MKTLIVYHSVHNHNTEKIANAISYASNAIVKTVKETGINDLKSYDLIGFGSGIFNFKHHRSLFEFVKKLGQLNNKNAFIFSTKAKFPESICHKKLKTLLTKKGLNIIGEFSCKGLVTFGPAKLFGGINKGHPDENDINNAKRFVKSMLNPVKN